ncbi:MAG: hypothetical protein HKN58_10005 [Xanthomonadales bacterium]|nr:hypothetical protein [Xanthomonadales bacterium]
MTEFKVRTATPADLPGIMGVEACWPEDQRATPQVFETRMQRFADGVFVTEVAGQVVGVTTSCPCHYEPLRVHEFIDWDHVTNRGLFPEPGSVKNPNALYIVSSGIMPAHRRSGIREAHLQAHFDLARRLDMAWVLTGAMLPGYDRYCREHGDIAAEDYARLKSGGDFVDPTIRKLAAQGMVLPGPDHVIADYYPSPESRDYGVLLVREL